MKCSNFFSQFLTVSISFSRVFSTLSWTKSIPVNINWLSLLSNAVPLFHVCDIFFYLIAFNLDTSLSLFYSYEKTKNLSSSPDDKDILARYITALRNFESRFANCDDTLAFYYFLRLISPIPTSPRSAKKWCPWFFLRVFDHSLFVLSVPFHLLLWDRYYSNNIF